MKDQYFGDARDYFKYQLLENLMMNVPTLQRLLCLWMLTPPDASREGNVSFVDSSEHSGLADFLRGHVESGDRRVSHMRDYFGGREFEYLPWGDEPPHFSRERRHDYFASIPEESLRQSLVFFDPDIGLTTERPSNKHLSLDELTEVFDRMDNESIAVVFQYWPRKRDFWNTLADELGSRLIAPVRFVAEPSVAFYVVPKKAAHVAPIEKTLDRVASGHRSRIVGPVGV